MASVLKPKVEGAVMRPHGNRPRSSLRRQMLRHWQLYAIIIVPCAFLAVFNYLPMVGVQIAFRNFNPVGGIWHSPWVGLQEIKFWLTNPEFWPILKNTLIIGVYSLIVGTISAVILALMLNEVMHLWFKKAIQTISYVPYFLSSVVLVGMMMIILAPQSGPLAGFYHLFGSTQVPSLFNDPGAFYSLFVWSGVWQGTGFAAVIYLAALSNANLELYDAARIDGASRLQRIQHIDWPTIKPTVILLTILGIGGILGAASFEKIYLMQNPLNMSSSQVFSTYVYQVGLLDGNYSFSAAVGLFNSVVGFVLIILANLTARWVSNTSLF